MAVPAAAPVPVPAAAPVRLAFAGNGDAFSARMVHCHALDAHLLSALTQPQLTINYNW